MLASAIFKRISRDCILGTTRCFASLRFNLADQSNSATSGHARANGPLTTAQRNAIVAFETGLHTRTDSSTTTPAS